jgi:hypothetical protein
MFGHDVYPLFLFVAVLLFVIIKGFFVNGENGTKYCVDFDKGWFDRLFLQDAGYCFVLLSPQSPPMLSRRLLLGIYTRSL